MVVAETTVAAAVEAVMMAAVEGATTAVEAVAVAVTTGVVAVTTAVTTVVVATAKRFGADRTGSRRPGQSL